MIEPASMVDWAQAVMIGGAFAASAIMIGKTLRDDDEGTAAVVAEPSEERILQEIGSR